MKQDDFAPRPPNGQVERTTAGPGRPAAASYAAAVPRLCRRLPAAPGDRREAVRPDGEPWRGRLVDLER
jgi:hypothetical protein